MIYLGIYFAVGLLSGVVNVVRAQVIGREPMPVPLAGFVVLGNVILWPIFGPIAWAAAEKLR